MALGNDGIRPDRLELRIRFAFGFVFGLAAASWIAHGFVGLSNQATALAALLSGLTLGGLARRYGDRFWSSLRWWWL